MRRFVVVGAHARGDGGFRLDDLAGSSGRIDVLLRCARAGLLVSHGVRRDAAVYLALHGGEAPRCLRFDGATARFLRPDERSLATLAKKALAARGPEGGGFAEVRPGVSLAERGLAAALDDCAGAALYLLDEGGGDVRDATWTSGDLAFVLGGHKGLDDASREALSRAALGSLSVGPRSVHADDAVAVLSNELDRRGL